MSREGQDMVNVHTRVHYIVLMICEYAIHNIGELPVVVVSVLKFVLNWTLYNA